jgi:hypothetical protein
MKISLTLTLDGGTKEEAISDDFSPLDLEMLRSYCRVVARLRDAKLLVRGMPAITDINWDQHAGFRVVCPPIENSELYELLHLLRPVVLAREPASFEKVAALLGKRFQSHAVRNWLKTTRRVFDHGVLNLYMQMTFNDQPLFDDSLLKLWLNGEQYHQDEDKAAKLAELEAALSKENMRAIVVNQLQGRVRAAFDLDHIASLIVKRADSRV